MSGTDFQNVPKKVAAVRKANAAIDKKGPTGKPVVASPDAQLKDVSSRENLVAARPGLKLSENSSASLTADKVMNIFYEEIIKPATVSPNQFQDNHKEGVKNVKSQKMKDSSVNDERLKGRMKSKIPIKARNVKITNGKISAKDRRTSEEIIKEILRKNTLVDESAKTLTVNDNRPNETAGDGSAGVASVATQASKTVFSDFKITGQVTNTQGRGKSRTSYEEKINDIGGPTMSGEFSTHKPESLQDVSYNNQGKRTSGRQQTPKSNERHGKELINPEHFLCDTCKADCNVTEMAGSKKTVKVTRGIPKRVKKEIAGKEKTPEAEDSFLRKEMNEEYILDEPEDTIPFDDQLDQKFAKRLLNLCAKGRRSLVQESSSEGLQRAYSPQRINFRRRAQFSNKRNSLMVYKTSLAKWRRNVWATERAQNQLLKIDLSHRKLISAMGDDVKSPPTVTEGKPKAKPPPTPPTPPTPPPPPPPPPVMGTPSRPPHTLPYLVTKPLNVTTELSIANSLRRVLEPWKSELDIGSVFGSSRALWLKPVTKGSQQHQKALQLVHLLRKTTPTSHTPCPHIEALKELQTSDTHIAFMTARMANLRKSPAVVRWPQPPEDAEQNIPDTEPSRVAWWEDAKPSFRIDEHLFGTQRFDPHHSLELLRCYFLSPATTKHHQSPANLKRYFPLCRSQHSGSLGKTRHGECLYNHALSGGSSETVFKKIVLGTIDHFSFEAKLTGSLDVIIMPSFYSQQAHGRSSVLT